MARVLITGGAGFFGTVLKHRLLDEGFECWSVNLCPDPTVRNGFNLNRRRHCRPVGSGRDLRPGQVRCGFSLRRPVGAQGDLLREPANYLKENNPFGIDDFRTIDLLGPEFVVVPIKVAGMEKPASAGLKHYEQRAVFNGGMFWKTGILEPDIYVLFERKD